MTRADRIVRLGLAGAVALLGTLPAAAQPVQAWSAMEGVEPATLLQDIRDMPLSEVAIDDQPYCADDFEIAFTLSHDFGEEPIETAGAQGTELWGSDLLGTWTLVAPRDNETSCIIASGVGYSDDEGVDTYFTVAGL
ncbi:hypothetical protein D3P06_09500 [Paracoccus aestuarii]|uniref:Uncharacterized protein n=1 Tax=Paracoccus aestuarii TaxID=453842 RepID=A0A418ZVT6_9RHOB|nr:hypothetical protein [Paracoccus aestuarii]RJL04087.1 hypothetical protein D3P06_09500 [Paracoccus aestuarii]WCQ99281.1 hypothetical protein JHW48_00440 [Paracoccus aestuarii]